MVCSEQQRNRMLFQDQSDIAIPGRTHFAPIIAETLNLTTITPQSMTYTPSHSGVYCINKHLFRGFSNSMNVTLIQPYGHLPAYEYAHLPVLYSRLYVDGSFTVYYPWRIWLLAWRG
jgi:hypothetical protein